MDNKTLDLGDDDVGYVSVKLCGTEQKLDLWQVHNALLDLHQEHQNDSPGAWIAAVQEFLASRGFPPCSQHMAGKFADAIFARVKDLGNAEVPGGSAGQRDTTEPSSAS